MRGSIFMAVRLLVVTGLIYGVVLVAQHTWTSSGGADAFGIGEAIVNVQTVEDDLPYMPFEDLPDFTAPDQR